MALLTSRCTRGALLALLVGFPTAAAGQDPLPGKPSDPPALRIPPQSLKSEQTTEQDRGGDAAPGREPAEEGAAEGGAARKIREMLQGEGEPEQTGDPILDGVLDLLRSRGSVLDGSPLDPRSEDSDPRSEDPQPLPDNRQPQPLPGGGLWVPYIDGDGRPGVENRPASDPSRYLLAEQLLKTARLLAAEPHADAPRRRLIEDLRNEASRLLAPQPSPAAEPLLPPDRGPRPADHSESY